VACCMHAEEEARQDLDAHVLAGILSWAYDARLDPTRPPVEPFPARAKRSPADGAFYARWRFYTYWPVGVSLLESYLVARHHALSPAEKGWIGAQCEAWLSIWEALEIRLDVGMRMRDLLTGEERFVFASAESRQLMVGACVLARVISFSRKACLCGGHPNPMTRRAGAAAAIVARELVARGRALPEGERIPIAWMQEEATAGMLVDLWEEATAHARTVN